MICDYHPTKAWDSTRLICRVCGATYQEIEAQRISRMKRDCPQKCEIKCFRICEIAAVLSTRSLFPKAPPGALSLVELSPFGKLSVVPDPVSDIG